MNCEITYEDLAAFAAGDVGAERQAEIRQHVGGCERCGKRLAALDKADAALEHLRPYRPGGAALLTARRALGEELRGSATTEIMTLEEVGEFLRLTGEQLGEIVEQLPAFELAGQIRIRRTRLVEWLQQRERDYARQSAASWAARANVGEFRTGVA